MLGLFTWSDDPEDNNRKIDIEFSLWGASDGKNAQYVVQPETSARIRRFELPSGRGRSVHTMRWEEGKVTFESRAVHGGQDSQGAIGTWTATSGVPRPGGENASSFPPASDHPMLSRSSHGRPRSAACGTAGNFSKDSSFSLKYRL
ncbi:MAG: hypothetical protein HY748_13925 [Elusimicrobia bacterium]|nr:hypothetical protein [Elusimicrobiota bacterium]